MTQQNTHTTQKAEHVSVNTSPHVEAASLVRKIHRSLLARIHGLFDRSFDNKHNVETRRIVNISDLNKNDNPIELEHYEIDELYAGTPTLIFNFLHAPVKKTDYVNATYIDIGAGKGRILIQAANKGFKKLLGIEFVSSLAQQGQDNCAKALKGRDLFYEVRERDARTLIYPNTDIVIFLYNPFDLPVFEKFLENLLKSLHHIPRRMTLIYNHDFCASFLENHPNLVRVKYPLLARIMLRFINPHSYSAWQFRAE